MLVSPRIERIFATGCTFREFELSNKYLEVLEKFGETKIGGTQYLFIPAHKQKKTIPFEQIEKSRPN